MPRPVPHHLSPSFGAREHGGIALPGDTDSGALREGFLPALPEQGQHLIGRIFRG